MLTIKSRCAAGLALLCTLAQAAPERICRAYAARVPNVKVGLCEAAQLADLQARSVQGRTIWTRDIAAPDARLRVLVLGGIHGDELSSSALVFHWISLAQQRRVQEPIPMHWRFIPALNPDGMFSRPARRVNARGVDLNRNFPTPNWARESKVYWEQRARRDPRRWPGPTALSEPESRFLQSQMEAFQPHLIVSVHAPFGVLDFDGPTAPPRQIGRLFLDQVGIYPGSLGNYGGVHKGVPVVTLELPNARSMPAGSEIERMWADLLRWTGDKLVTSQSAQAALPGPSAR